MKTYRLAVAGRFADREQIKEKLSRAGINRSPFQLKARWLESTIENDAELTTKQANLQVRQNRDDIIDSDALLYFPCYTALGTPLWSPGRLVDVGMAIAIGRPIIVVGTPEPSIYFKSHLVTVCQRIQELAETVKMVLERSPR